MKSTVILAAKPFSDAVSYQEQLTPIRGKPAIAWVVENYLKSHELIIVLNENNIKTKTYIQNNYPETKFALVNAEKQIEEYGSFSILNSLNSALDIISYENVEIVLGDTLCDEVQNNDIDLILTSKDFSAPERWCLAEADEDRFVKTIYDKQKNIDITNKEVFVGYYQFADAKLLSRLTKDAIANGKRQLSDVITIYNESHKILLQEATTWFDLGHKSGIIKAQNNFFNSREFNSLLTDQIRGTITKHSTKKQKLADEYAWYKNLPEELSILAPRVIDYTESIDTASLTMEMYGYSALSELFILGNLTLEEWQLIVSRLFDFHKLLKDCKGQLEKDNFYDLYLHKTWQRLEELQEQKPYWLNIWNYGTITINGKVNVNIKQLQAKINESIEELVNSVDVTVMHGDYCFSNILFDTNSFICRLIDPRGRLGVQTIYGDPRYDIAKLRHSVVGGYDFAVHGLFSLKEDGNQFEVVNNCLDFQEELTTFFDEKATSAGFDIKQIKLIEALLFLSMIPLHKDNIERQKIFYLKAVEKFNDLFGEKND